VKKYLNENEVKQSLRPSYWPSHLNLNVIRKYMKNLTLSHLLFLRIQLQIQTHLIYRRVQTNKQLTRKSINQEKLLLQFRKERLWNKRLMKKRRWKERGDAKLVKLMTLIAPLIALTWLWHLNKNVLIRYSSHMLLASLRLAKLHV